MTVSMLTSCSKNQVLQWNGSSWACSNAGAGTVTGVTAGTDLTGGGTGGSVTLNLDTTKVPQLAASNSFTGNQTLNASGGTVLNVTQTASSGTSYGINATTRANTDGNAAIISSALASAEVYEDYRDTFPATAKLAPESLDRSARSGCSGQLSERLWSGSLG